MIHQLYLRSHSTDLMKYGSDIHFESIDNVTFENQHLYAGQTIATWSTMTEFWKTVMQNPLPRLIQNHEYKLKIRYESKPEKRLYVKIVFYDRYKERISQLVLKESVNSFEVPENTIHYEIQLINGGLVYFRFQQIELIPVQDSDEDNFLQEDDLLISGFINPDEQDHTLRLMFTEPRLSTVHPTDISLIPEAKNVVQISSSLALAHFYLVDNQLDQRIISQIRDLIQEYEVEKIDFIGYGPISNFASQLYSHQIEDIPAISYLLSCATASFPMSYRKIEGYERFEKYSDADQKGIVYYQPIENPITADVNTETSLTYCPSWYSEKG